LVIVPIRTFHRRIEGNTDVTAILVSARDGVPTEKVEENIERLMRERRRISRGQDDDFNVMDMKEIVGMLTGTTRVLTSLLSTVAAVSLLVGGIGIMNIMLVSVTERTREIGVRKALGATGFNIMFQFLIESLVVCSAGGVIGILVGVGAALALAELCYRTVLEHGRQARKDVAAGQVSDAVEVVVEANTLLSGLGFESGGLAAAHSLYAGLSLLPAGSGYLHGEKVAFGVIVQTVLENWPTEERQELLDFYRDVGLPVALREIGLGQATSEDLRRAAEVACRPGSHMHNLRRPISVEELVTVLGGLRG